MPLHVSIACCDAFQNPSISVDLACNLAILYARFIQRTLYMYIYIYIYCRVKYKKRDAFYPATRFVHRHLANDRILYFEHDLDVIILFVITIYEAESTLTHRIETTCERVVSSRSIERVNINNYTYITYISASCGTAGFIILTAGYFNRDNFSRVVFRALRYQNARTFMLRQTL